VPDGFGTEVGLTDLGGGLQVLTVDLHHSAEAQEHLESGVGVARASGRLEEAGQAIGVASAQL
jgi:hypothetical protein